MYDNVTSACDHGNKFYKSFKLRSAIISNDREIISIFLNIWRLFFLITINDGICYAKHLKMEISKTFQMREGVTMTMNCLGCQVEFLLVITRNSIIYLIKFTFKVSAYFLIGISLDSNAISITMEAISITWSHVNTMINMQDKKWMIS